MFLYSTVSTLKPEEANEIDKVAMASLTNGRNGGHNFTKLKLVEDGCFTGSIQTDHQDAHFLLAKKAREELGNIQTHSVQ